MGWAHGQSRGDRPCSVRLRSESSSWSLALLSLFGLPPPHFSLVGFPPPRLSLVGLPPPHLSRAGFSLAELSRAGLPGSPKRGYSA